MLSKFGLSAEDVRDDRQRVPWETVIGVLDRVEEAIGREALLATGLHTIHASDVILDWPALPTRLRDNHRPSIDAAMKLLDALTGASPGLTCLSFLAPTQRICQQRCRVRVDSCPSGQACSSFTQKSYDGAVEGFCSQ